MSVLRRNRLLHVRRACGHHEEVRIGTCSDPVAREAAQREAQQPCIHCRLEQNERERQARFAALTIEERRAELAAVFGD